MHMADALLSPAVGAGFYAVTGGLLGAAARQVARENHYERQAPLMGVLGAFVFAAQMINFTIPGTGSSGHIGGGLLLASLLGPWAALLVMASILTVQCLFFADGGLLALGANIFNLGFWPAFVGLPLYRVLAGAQPSRGRRTLAAVAGTIAALELGALSVAIETVLSGRSELPFGRFAAIMLGIHLPIALVEGLITAAVLLLAQRLFAERNGGALSVPELNPAAPRGLLVMAGLALAAGGVLAWFASAHPDGLEWSIARIHGVPELPAAESGLAAQMRQIQDRTALLPDYSLPAPPGAAEENAADEPAPWPAVNAGTSLAGLVGAGVTALLIWLIGWLLRRMARLTARRAAA